MRCLILCQFRLIRQQEIVLEKNLMICDQYYIPVLKYLPKKLSAKYAVKQCQAKLVTKLRRSKENFKIDTPKQRKILPPNKDETMNRLRSLSTPNENGFFQKISSFCPAQIKDYANEILQQLIKQENYGNPSQKYNSESIQHEINKAVAAHLNLNMKQETLHLAICYFQQYNRNNFIPETQLSVVMSTCLWMASKFEQIYPPKMKYFLMVGNCTKQGMVQYEAKILKSNGFKLVKKTPYLVLEILCGEDKEKLKLCNLVLHLYFYFYQNESLKSECLALSTYRFWRENKIFEVKSCLEDQLMKKIRLQQTNEFLKRIQSAVSAMEKHRILERKFGKQILQLIKLEKTSIPLNMNSKNIRNSKVFHDFKQIHD